MNTTGVTAHKNNGTYDLRNTIYSLLSNYTPIISLQTFQNKNYSIRAASLHRSVPPLVACCQIPLCRKGPANNANDITQT
ncbi:hypothetical protein CEXT_179771 [Caerostris extrusa]|uniref:Uncharacterized protein n=1 Tax=Caerostris extrusa TaxID=172846 RepID=A0AAV4UV54_CAEEX|nr:hypothetical protein CEXT_179771 [Caerostris extrusa]